MPTACQQHQDRVCRGASASDNFGSYFEVIQSSGIQSCAAACAEQKCQGIEFSPGRCEIWVRPEGIGATASLHGSVCLRRLGTAVTAKGFSFFKFVPMTLRHNGIADAVAISELSLYKEGKVLDARNAVASNLNGETSLDEGPEKAFDNDNSSKWLDKNFSDLMLQFPQPVEIDAFSFTTANDHSQRDPLQWALMGSTDGTEWSNMHLQLMDYETPKERLTQSHSFSLQPGQWAIRIRTNHTNTGWMWLVYGLEMTTGDGALVEPNAVCSAFDSETAFDGGAERHGLLRNRVPGNGMNFVPRSRFGSACSATAHKRSARSGSCKSAQARLPKLLLSGFSLAKWGGGLVPTHELKIVNSTSISQHFEASLKHGEIM